MSIVKPETQKYLPLIKAAWNQVKGAMDPIFDACHSDHQLKLIYQAENVVEKGASEDPFEQAFQKLLHPPPKVKAPATEAAPVKTTAPLPSKEEKPVKDPKKK